MTKRLPITFFFTHYLICYDVKDCSRGQKIRTTLQGYCYQQQESVFEGELTPSQIEKLKEELLLILAKEDCLIIYPLTKQNIFSKKVYGTLQWRIKRIF